VLWDHIGLITAEGFKEKFLQQVRRPANSSKAMKARLCLDAKYTQSNVNNSQVVPLKLILLTYLE